MDAAGGSRISFRIVLAATAFGWVYVTLWYVVMVAVCSVVYWIEDEIPDVAKQISKQINWPRRAEQAEAPAPPLADWEPEAPPRH